MTKRGKTSQKRHGLHRGRIVAGVVVCAVLLGVGVTLWRAEVPERETTAISAISASGDQFDRVPAGQLPAFAASNSSLVQMTYRYAVAHPDVLRHIPCYCGCEGAGHRHNGDCYVQARHADGTITFTSHGAT